MRSFYCARFCKKGPYAKSLIEISQQHCLKGVIMRTEHLKFFVTLAETGSIMQTGKKLYTTHQNVSKVIRQLEDDLDTTLFHRNQKGVTLSATGKLLLPLAQRTMRDFDALRADIQTSTGNCVC